MVDLNDQESSGGNATPNNVETVMFDGHQVWIGKNEQGEDVIDPLDAPPEVVEKLTQQASSLVASYNKKNLDAKKKLAELEGGLSELELKKKELEIREREIENKRKELELASLNIPNSKPKTDDDYLVEAFGTADNDEILELEINDRKEYLKRQAKYNALIATERQMSQLSAFQQEQSLNSAIMQAGYHPDMVRAFANTWGIGSMQKAFELYKQQNPITQAPVTNIRGQKQAEAPKVLPGSLKTSVATDEEAKIKKQAEAWKS